jgi:hypothetical protein
MDETADDVTDEGPRDGVVATAKDDAISSPTETNAKARRRARTERA